MINSKLWYFIINSFLNLHFDQCGRIWYFLQVFIGLYLI